jgi:DNA-nicking Smr family endonuclease
MGDGNLPKWREEVELDLHGYDPDDIDMVRIAKEAWELGARTLRLIHGHGRSRGTQSSPCSFLQTDG